MPATQQSSGGFHTEARRLPIFAVSLSILILMATPSKVFADATPEWRLISRQAYHLQRDLRYPEAIEKYKLALSMLGDADTEITRELRLNIAAMILLSGQTVNGLSALKALEPVFAKDKTSVQAMRYWRRVRDAYGLLNNFEQAIEAQRKVLEIGKQNFETESPIYLDEVRKLMDLYSFSNHLSESAALAAHLLKLVPTLAPVQRGRFIDAINTANDFGLNGARLYKQRGHFKKALESLRLVKRSTDPKLYLERLNELAQTPMPYEPKLRSEIMLETLELSAKLLPDIKAIEINRSAQIYLDQERDKQ